MERVYLDILLSRNFGDFTIGASVSVLVEFGLRILKGL